MANVFRPGDVVRLKSGGPNMTVHESYEPTQNVFTSWFFAGKLQSANFRASTLEPVYDAGVNPPPQPIETKPGPEFKHEPVCSSLPEATLIAAVILPGIGNVEFHVSQNGAWISTSKGWAYVSGDGKFGHVDMLEI